MQVSFAAGVVLQGRYVVRALIARGGMAEVYQADDTRLQLPVAIKRLTSGEPSTAAAFEREAILLARLRHPALPHVTDMFAERDARCMVMQLIPGTPLTQILARGGYNLGDAVRWITGAVDAIGYLQRLQPPIVHGDIKPHNLLIDGVGAPVLLDLGVACAAGSSAGPFAFTAEYAAPEQLRGQALSLQTDLFGIGATLYQLITGHVPLDSQSRLQILAQRQIDPLRPAHELNPHVPAALSALVAQLLALDPAQRPPDAAQLAGALDRLATAASPVAATAVQTVAPTASPPRYQLLRSLGEGGMGQAFLAHDRERGIDVCLKRIHPTTAPAALRQECAAIARLDHPGIVRLLDYQLDGDDRYMITELVSGPTLARYIRDRGPVDAPVALELGRRLFDALDYAHDHAIIHCDVKPANIIVERRSAELSPKLLDFGIAIVDRVDDQGMNTGAGRVGGTPAYMAPEQFLGEELTGACDIYAAALIVVELLQGTTGRARDVTFHDIWRARQQRPFAFDDLTRSIPALPAPIARALQFATARDPRQRPTARELLAIFHRAVPPIQPPSVWAPVAPSLVTAIGQPPPGWFNSVGLVDGVSTDYAYSAEADGNAPALRLASTDRVGPDDFGSLMQRCPIWHLAGARVELSARLAIERVDGRAALWLRIDGADGGLAFDNMADRPLRGTQPWTRYTVQLDVPTGAEWLNYGLLLSGTGAVRAADIQLVATVNGRSQQLTL